ncbi:hypothetical protein PIB30_032446 [Stylosanthes scabra]|uniref:PGG domain-containing protein n=1 Tax=Stylosanthes scabra TaxID=79078 RepID=A0ABU6RCY2_9FABA|nr:hypothetical protein [Stylosanthes scabra]
MEDNTEIENLFSYTIKGQIREVLEVYEKNHLALEAKITRLEDTVLHIAVYVGQTNFVATLLDNISEEVCFAILKLQNSKGNTPLHLAAELGNVEICYNLAKRDPTLISWRNFQGETPLFLAAIHGKKDAFFCLYRHQESQDDYSLCSKNNGDTILHCTISSEYFGLALKILDLYPNLADSVNQDGLSPLHILAMKPNCFKSSTRMESLDRFVYNCLIVDDVSEEAVELHKNQKDKQKTKYPMNYSTCVSFVSLFMRAAKAITFGKHTSKAEAADEENLSRKSYLGYEKEMAKKETKYNRFPPNCETIIRILIVTTKALLLICGVGSSWIDKIQRRKARHMQAKKVMNELIQRATLYKYSGRTPHGKGKTIIGMQNGTHLERRTDSPILIAAKMGITEMVEKILDIFPVAIQDVDSENKNVVLLAIENRQPHVYNMLNKSDIAKESAFRQVDSQGNSALHLAATYKSHKPWRVPGAAMQMQWEYKWYKLVKNSMPPNFYERYNNKGQTAKQVFVSTHGQLVKEGGKWLTKTAESCSVVAALVATVAFTTSTAIPGGPDQNTGVPLLRGRPAFNLFAVAALIALCSSVTSLVLFLSVLTSRFQEKDFAVDLPRKLLLGLTTLFTSIASVLISFCAGHYFIIEDELKYAVFPIYAATCLPVSFFALVQLPLYFDLALAMFRKVPQRSYKALPHYLPGHLH